MTEGEREIDLFESLKRNQWFKLPLEAMRDVGPAVQTLAGLLRITSRETYVKVAEISEAARVPVPTARKHLVRLSNRGWIENTGRQQTRYGAPRRTCTIRVAARTREALKGKEGQLTYGVLPWWACCTLRGSKRLSWASRAVLSIIMARLMSLRAVVERQDGQADLDAEDLWGSIENLGGEDRFKFSLSHLQRDTGLSRESLVAAKRELARRKIIKWQRPSDESFNGCGDILWPSESFRVSVTPASEGRCYVAFQG